MTEEIVTTGTINPTSIAEPATTIATTGTTTVSSATLESKIEGVANTIADAAAATGLTQATVADAALHGIENVVGGVQQDLANHASNLQTALDGLVNVANNSTAVVAKVSPAAGIKVQTWEQKITAFVADLRADLADIF